MNSSFYAMLYYSLTNRYSTLRPFQRKSALIATATDLINSLDFLNDYHRQEIMFRTQASREPLDSHLAWRRMKQISREINETILPKAKEVIENEDNMEKSHDEICDALLQSMFVSSFNLDCVGMRVVIFPFSHVSPFDHRFFVPPLDGCPTHH